MSYQVLARKYRPQQFEDLIAQEHISRTLKNALNLGRLSSGYLFTGPRGTGKTTTARILAKAMNCAEGPASTPCDKCPSCLEIISGSSLDVMEIDAASNTGVDDIRTLRENVRYLPSSGKKRIYIIDEVHRLSGSAFDALLKTLEEPPPHVVFIFATTEPFKVPETIRSRTQRYDFRRVSVQELAAHVRKIASAENIKIDDEALFIIARKADGAVRDSLSLLDQLAAFSDEPITAKHVVAALGLVDRQLFFRYIDALAARNGSEALDIIGELINSGVEIPEFCTGLTEHLRNLLILQNAREPKKLLELSESEFEDFHKQADYFKTGDILRMIKILTDTVIDLKSGLDPRLILETSTLKLASLESVVNFEDVLAYLSDRPDMQILDSSPNLFGAAAIKSPGLALKARDDKSELTAAGSIDMGDVDILSARQVNLPIVQTNWSKFLEHLKTQSPMLSSMLSTVEIREVKDNVITAVYNSAAATSKQVVEKSNYLATISSALRDFFKSNLKIKFEVDLNKKASSFPKTVPPPPEKIDAEKLLAEDEKLRSIVEKIDGEIIGKRKIE
jgi:DNA polymerase-3 subunit gamma/tau